MHRVKYRHIHGCIHISLKHAGSHMGRCTQIYIQCDPLFGAGRASYNVSGTSCKLLEEDMTTYQEHLASYLKKILQRIRNIWQVTWRREEFTSYKERLASYLQKMLQRIRSIWQVTWRRYYNIAGTSCMLLEEVVPTYQERLASYLKKMLQRIRNVLQVTWRRCYKVAGTSCKLREEDVATYQ